MEFRQLGLHLPIAEPQRRTARGIETVQPVRFRIPHNREQIAPNAAADRLHEAERSVGGDSGVDRGAAGLQDVEPDLCRERLARAHHAMLRDDFRTSGKRPASDAIHLGHANRDRQKNEKRKEAQAERPG